MFHVKHFGGVRRTDKTGKNRKNSACSMRSGVSAKPLKRLTQSRSPGPETGARAEFSCISPDKQERWAAQTSSEA
jgi:hypothetical protein